MIRSPLSPRAFTGASSSSSIPKTIRRRTHRPRNGTSQYRLFVAAGTPHVPDPLDVAFFSNRTTPATYEPALRAHFLQGHRGVQHGAPPPPSTQLLASKGNKLDRDANGNAISVGPSGPVPRLPIIELGEARFISGFTGSYDGVKTIQDLGFANHQAYLNVGRGSNELFHSRLLLGVKGGSTVSSRPAAGCGPKPEVRGASKGSIHLKSSCRRALTHWVRNTPSPFRLAKQARQPHFNNPILVQFLI